MTENRGKDFNYFKTVTTTVTDGYDGYDGYFNVTPDITTAFRGARRMMLVGVSGSNVGYSFNGVHLHGRISAGQIFNFGIRAEDKIFFRGNGIVDVHIWHIGT
ncbi:hypothetical protein M0R72_02245 [Candidatus Pacearchaeota archaeon]|jgi:hypothetical protein|nr:hypothetical protein [Candidatus Pacearchaeota archaeon]